MKNKLYLLFIAVVLLIAVFIGGSELFHRSEMKRLDFLAQERAELFVRPHSPVKGDESAKIFVTEFLDPECESCRTMYPFVNEILKIYHGKVKVVIRYVPLHRNSINAIKALEASRKQNKYWEALEKLFEYQPVWGDHHNPRPDLVWVYLKSAGVDVDKAKLDMESQDIANIIEQDKADARELGVRGTPTFFVNGKPLSSFGPQALRQLIDQEIKEHNL